MEPRTKARFVDQNSVEVCSVCAFVVDGAVITPCCEMLFCATCICAHLEEASQCPECNAPLKASMLTRVCKVLGRMLGNWSVRCDFYKPALAGCPTTVRLRELQDHVRACPYNPDNPSTPKRTVNPSDMASEMLMASPSKLQGDVGDRLAARYTLSRVEDGKLRIKTSCRGKPQLFERRTQGSSIAQL